MTTKRAIWMGDKETVVQAISLHGDVPISVHVMHRRKRNQKTGKIHNYGWIHFSRSGGGIIDSNRKLRKLAHAILKSIGDIP
jgi:hypothetical protein